MTCARLAPGNGARRSGRCLPLPALAQFVEIVLVHDRVGKASASSHVWVAPPWRGWSLTSTQVGGWVPPCVRPVEMARVAEGPNAMRGPARKLFPGPIGSAVEGGNLVPDALMILTQD